METDMSQEQRSYEETDQEGRGLRVGRCYEIVQGPASSPERTTTGVLVGIDLDSKAYTFELDDGSRISMADNEIDGIRHVEEGC